LIINVKVIANAKQNKIKREGEKFKVYLTAPPVEGKANKLLIELLADYFKVKKDRVRILRGVLSSNKIVEVA